MLLLDAFDDLVTLIRGQVIDIPLNNGLAIGYVILNLLLNLYAIFTGGEVTLPGTGNNGGL